MKVSLDTTLEHLLIVRLNHWYEVGAQALSFIPLGDSAYSYEVLCEEGPKFYLKVFDKRTRRGLSAANRLHHYLPLTRRLHQEGIFTRLTYPIPTKIGSELAVDMGDFVMVLFNFIEGTTLANAYPFSKQILKLIAHGVSDIHHATQKLPAAPIPKDGCPADMEKSLLQNLSLVEAISTRDNLFKRRLAEVVLPRKKMIMDLLERFRLLRHTVNRCDVELVLCHGDVWGGNLILNPKGELIFLDWESAVLAPFERDLFGYLGDDFHFFLGEYQARAEAVVKPRRDFLAYYAFRHQLLNLSHWLQNILHDNVLDEQNENDIDMIENHCLSRWAALDAHLNQIP